MSNAAVDELLQELNYLIGSVSLPITQKTINQVLQGCSCHFDQSVVEKLTSSLCETNTSDKGPLQKEERHLNVVEPVEYILDRKKSKSFQYI